MANNKLASPNILVIYPDQMRYDACGAGGNSVINTPNIDRLAEESVFFENAHTSFPLCAPFRASFMTGKYSHANGMFANHYPIPLDQVFLADIFRENGYLTGYVGKWHLDGGKKHNYVKPEYRLGFERFIGFSRGHEYFNSIYYRNNDPNPYTTNQYQPDMQTGHVIEIMQEAVDAEKPFFAMINYGLPHLPFVMPDKYRNMYNASEMPIRDNTPEKDIDKSREFLAQYYGLVSCVDDNIGRLMAWLNEKEISNNTIVLLVSDHGEMAGEHGLREKKIYYEASTHVPYILRLPNSFSVSGQRCQALVDPAVDSMPTLLDLCGMSIPEAVQGKSFAPLLTGKTGSVREEIYYEILMEKEGPERFPVPERGIRTKDWLYVRNRQASMVLFDLKNDPLELHNLVDEKAYEPEIEKLAEKLMAHMQETNDNWELEAVFPPPDFMSHEEGEVFFGELLKKAQLG